MQLHYVQTSTLDALLDRHQRVEEIAISAPVGPLQTNGEVRELLKDDVADAIRYRIGHVDAETSLQCAEQAIDAWFRQSGRLDDRPWLSAEERKAWEEGDEPDTYAFFYLTEDQGSLL